MTRLRLATWNVEWFNALFDDRGRMQEDDAWSARYNITRADQLAALGIVFTAMDADAVMVIEAPDTNGKRSTVKALEGFAARMGLRARRALTGFVSATEQEIALLYDPDRITARHDPQGDAKADGKGGVPRFDGTFRMDLDQDAFPEPIRFSKPPLEVVLEVEGRKPLRLIGVHAKSKAPHGAKTPLEASRIAIDNRRKQLAECVWLRARVAAHLAAGDDLIVMGDFNDGPGLDEYEKLFGRSGVEIVMGMGEDAGLRLSDPHAEMALLHRIGLQPTTARFWNAEQERYFEALLDFIMVAPGLKARGGLRWRIWHPLNDPACWQVEELRAALLTASDHFPVTLDITG